MTTWTSGSGRLRAWDLDPNYSELETHLSSGIITAITSTSITIADVGYKLILWGNFSLTGALPNDFIGDRVDNLADFSGASGTVTRVDGYDAGNLTAIEVSLTNLNINIKTFASYASNDFVRDILSGNDEINGNAYYNDQDTNPAGKWQLDGAGNSFNGNRLHGYAGNDTLNGNRYVDSLWGDSGNDTLNGYANNDFLYGGAGNDILNGGVGNDKLYGQTGNDALNGEDGNDILISGSGTDTLDGGIGIDTADYSDQTKAVSITLNGSTYSNLTVNGLKTDRIKNIENLIGGTGSDLLTGDASSNTLSGGSGNDTLNGGANADTLIGGIGNDTYVVDNTGDVTTETSALLTEIDTVQSSVTRTLGNYLENLTLTGSAAINGTGNTLNNTITGNSAANILNGEAGNDSLNGGAGNDTLMGGAGDDWLEHTDDMGTPVGSDTLSGGTGNDTYVVDVLGATLVEATNEGADLVITHLSSFTLGANIENLTHDYGNEPGQRPYKNFTGTGNALNNIITSNGGNDTLSGLGGNDTLIGGLGMDTLIGGAGIDYFVFNTAYGSTNKDTITDFNTADDTIRLENSIFTKLVATGTLNASMFRSGAGITTAGDSNDHIIYNTTSGALYYDADAHGAAAAVQIALIGTSTHAALTYQDFAVI